MTAFERAITRMLMFVDGETLLAYDRAAVDAVQNGVSVQTIKEVALAFERAARTLPKTRAERIVPIMTGGFLDRLKIEATCVARHNRSDGAA